MGLLRRPLLWIPLVLLLLAGAMLIASYWAVPGLVRSQGDAWVAENLPDKQLTMGAVAFDPWRLGLVIDDLAIADRRDPSRPLVAARRLAIDANIASLWKLSPQLDAVSITAPAIDAVLRRDGTLNLAGLVPPDDGTPVPELWIGALSVVDGVIDFTDARTGTPQHQQLRPVSFNLRDFATRANEGGGFKFDARSAAGETLAWAGTIGMAPVASAGTFSIGGLQLATIGRFAGDLLPVALLGGAVDVAGNYRAAMPATAGGAPPPPQFDAEVTTLALRDAMIATRDGDRIGIKGVRIAPTRFSLAGDALNLGAVGVDGVTIVRPGGERAAIMAATLAPSRYAPATATADIGAATIDGVSITGKGRSPETIALAGLTIEPSRLDMSAQRASIGRVTASGLRLGARVAPDNSIAVPGLYPLPPSPAAAAGPAWTAQLAGFALADAAVRVAIDRPAPAETSVFNLAPLSARLGPVSTALDAPLDVQLDTRINGASTLAVAGTASPAALTADLAIDLSGLPLAAVAALAPATAVRVRDGSLDIKGRVRIANGKAGPAPDFNGRLAVRRLDIAQRGDDSDLLAWKALEMTGVRYQSVPQRLAIQRVAFDGVVSRVTITRQATLNLADVAGVETPALTAPPPAPAGDTPARIKVFAPVSTSVSAAGKLFPITIDVVTVKDGRVAFADYSVQPNFAAGISGLSGSVSGLSTAPGSQAKFNLNGYVIDRYAPVSITGFANPFAYDANTDLTAKFTNIELPVFNPYSGRFAGYAIAKGKLSTTIHYRIVNRALNAQHNVVLDQLTWGEATDSKDKVSLPLRLATSLLKDKNGVIDLDLPVEGTLDDPEFKIWPVVWQVVGNVLTKLVTAPFALIGSLFGSGPEAQFVTFVPGSALLPPEATTSLKAVAKGLAEKTEVNLDIPAGPAGREDAEALTTAAIETAVLAGKKGPVASDYAAFDVGKKADRLKSIYKARFGSGPKFPDDAGVTKAGMFAGAEAKAAASAAQVAWLEAALRPKFAPDPAVLAALGQARAAAVKDALLSENAIEASRVFIATDKAVAAKDGKVVMELTVK